MGCFWAARSRASIPEGDRVSTDSEPVIFDGKCRIQEKDCKGGCGCVIYEYRGSLTFNGTPGNLWYPAAGGGFFACCLCRGPEAGLPPDEDLPVGWPASPGSAGHRRASKRSG